MTRRRQLQFVAAASAVVFLVSSYAAFRNFKQPAVPRQPQVLGQVVAAPAGEVSKDLTRVKPTYSVPTRLVIPRIKVDTGILQMGLTAEGEMEVPEKIEDLGWYKHGPNPGNEGSAVIAGHLGVGKRGVFVDLAKLQIGDVFWVIDDREQTIFFVVKKKKTYQPSERPREVFFSKDGQHLNLITCAGKWSKADQGMTERLVVFADKV